MTATKSVITSLYMMDGAFGIYPNKLVYFSSCYSHLCLSGRKYPEQLPILPLQIVHIAGPRCFDVCEGLSVCEIKQATKSIIHRLPINLIIIKY